MFRKLVFGALALALFTPPASADTVERKSLQVEHAPGMSTAAAMVKLADKTCNIRDMASSPPADWPLFRGEKP